jgi:hypothetical protein
MNKDTAMIIFTLGFLMTFGGVGGVETSVTDAEFITSLVVSCLGLLVMWAGSLGLRVSHYYD